MINICPPLERMFEEVRTGRKLDYTPLQVANEFEKYIDDIRANPIEVETIYKRQNRKEGLVRDTEEKQQQNRTEQMPRAPRVSDFVVRWLGKDMSWWSKLSDKNCHKDWEEFFNIKHRVNNYCRDAKLNGATVGIFNANIISRELGLTDKQQVDQNTTQVVIHVNNQDEANGIKELASME